MFCFALFSESKIVGFFFYYHWDHIIIYSITKHTTKLWQIFLCEKSLTPQEEGRRKNQEVNKQASSQQEPTQTTWIWGWIWGSSNHKKSRSNCPIVFSQCCCPRLGWSSGCLRRQWGATQQPLSYFHVSRKKEALADREEKAVFGINFHLCSFAVGPFA